MKKSLLVPLLVTGLLGAATAAWSLPQPIYTINSNATTVGLEDTRLASGDISSGDGTEETWVNAQLGLLGRDPVKLAQKYTSVDTFWYQTDQKDAAGKYLYALDLNALRQSDPAGPSIDPEYFLIKTGNNHNDEFTHYLFENRDDLQWAVIGLDDIGSITDLETISHLDEFSPAPSVPEPGTMMLLGAGCLGIAIYGKRRKNA